MSIQEREFFDSVKLEISDETVAVAVNALSGLLRMKSFIRLKNME